MSHSIHILSIQITCKYALDFLSKEVSHFVRILDTLPSPKNVIIDSFMSTIRSIGPLEKIHFFWFFHLHKSRLNAYIVRT